MVSREAMKRDSADTLPPRNPVRALRSLLSVALSSLTVKRETLYHKKVELNYSLLKLSLTKGHEQGFEVSAEKLQTTVCSFA